MPSCQYLPLANYCNLYIYDLRITTIPTFFEPVLDSSNRDSPFSKGLLEQAQVFKTSKNLKETAKIAQINAKTIKNKNWIISDGSFDKRTHDTGGLHI